MCVHGRLFVAVCQVMDCHMARVWDTLEPQTCVTASSPGGTGGSVRLPTWQASHLGRGVHSRDHTACRFASMTLV
jgi:hypothetical protein